MFRFIARFARVGILNSRPGGSREVLVSVSGSNFPFYSILLTLALFFCSYVVSIYFYPRINFCRLGLLSGPRWLASTQWHWFHKTLSLNMVHQHGLTNYIISSRFSYKQFITYNLIHSIMKLIFGISGNSFFPFIMSDHYIYLHHKIA